MDFIKLQANYDEIFSGNECLPKVREEFPSDHDVVFKGYRNGGGVESNVIGNIRNTVYTGVVEPLKQSLSPIIENFSEIQGEGRQHRIPASNNPFFKLTVF